MNYKVILLLLDFGIALVMAFIAYRKSRVPGAISLMVLSSSLMIWALSYLLYEILPDLALDKLWIAILFFSMTCAASAQFTFSLSYTNHPNWLTRSAIILLGVVPLATQLLFWVKPWSTIFFQNQAILESPYVFGSLWGRITTFYIYNLTAASVLLLFDTYIRKPRSLFFRSWTILVGAGAPLLVQTLNMVGFNLFPQAMIPLFAFTLSGLGFSYGLFSQKLIEAIPVTRDSVVEGMDDGWMVLNAQNIIIDINPAAESIVGMSREKVYGKTIASIMSDMPSLGSALGENQELEMKRSIKSKQGWRYLNIRVSPLRIHSDQYSGHLIAWRDITDQRMAEDARRRAREELFVLLNAISSAASNTIDLNDFLLESIYQIIYPFRSQIVGVFLLDERNKGGDDQRLFLTANLGLSPEALDAMTFMPMSNPLVEWAFKNRQAFLIDNMQNDPRLPPAMQGIALSCFLVLPLVSQTGEENKFIGLIFMARREGPVFSQDEMVRLTMISDHIATLIDSDRRRKLAIALSERQRLLRDLHDSVSQKLYGLVTLTEAAQAGLEAGASVNPAQLLAKIGENARQAVKELRLFLYQMQPIEIEKEGLISALHHRLAAVEGRADIKARLLADENISLSNEKEIALYFIAQEALNNILRHARAKSITVHLKQGRRNVILEVFDDGCGFDPKKVERGGLGLRNMKERALQAHGKLKIISKPDVGTKIITTVPRDQAAKPIKHRRRL